MKETAPMKISSRYGKNVTLSCKSSYVSTSSQSLPLILILRVRKQPIIALYFKFENELKFYNLEASILNETYNFGIFMGGQYLNPPLYGHDLSVSINAPKVNLMIFLGGAYTFFGIQSCKCFSCFL